MPPGPICRGRAGVSGGERAARNDAEHDRKMEVQHDPEGTASAPPRDSDDVFGGCLLHAGVLMAPRGRPLALPVGCRFQLARLGGPVEHRPVDMGPALWAGVTEFSPKPPAMGVSRVRLLVLRGIPGIQRRARRPGSG